MCTNSESCSFSHPPQNSCLPPACSALPTFLPAVYPSQAHNEFAAGRSWDTPAIEALQLTSSAALLDFRQTSKNAINGSRRFVVNDGNLRFTQGYAMSTSYQVQKAKIHYPQTMCQVYLSIPSHLTNENSNVQ
ncbi:uncharacterized protein ACBT44_010881 isoform 1-T7 [Syngnathus typhle]